MIIESSGSVKRATPNPTSGTMMTSGRSSGRKRRSRGCRELVTRRTTLSQDKPCRPCALVSARARPTTAQNANEALHPLLLTKRGGQGGNAPVSIQRRDAAEENRRGRGSTAG